MLVKRTMLALLAAISISACNKPAPSGKAETVLIKVNQSTSDSSAVALNNYVLVTGKAGADSAEATAIIELKKQLPLALKQRDSVLFNNLLTDDFIYRGKDEFFTKKDYINSRLNAKWSVDTVRYTNMALQIFNELAVLSYHTTLQRSGETEHYNQADIYEKENGKWKIKAIHEIEAYLTTK